MKYMFLLPGDYIGLGREEIVSLFDILKFKANDRLLITDLNGNLDRKLVKRLALAKSIYQFLFQCKIDNLAEVMKIFDWNSVYEYNFCLRMIHLDSTLAKKPINEKINNKNKKNQKLFSEKKLAAYVWHSLRNPKVDLNNPKTLIQLFIIKDKAYCGLLVYTNKENFESRKSHLRPFPHPSSLHPKIARALANISGIKHNEVLLDPFCGTGGFLMESGLMGMKSIGYDINKIMIDGCIDNLKHYKITDYKIKKRNAVEINDKFDYAVTDLPYGLNSNVISEYHKENWKKGRINKKVQTKNFVRDLENFYLRFLKNLRKKLNKKAVIVFPSYVNHRKLLKQSKFKIEFECSDYIHRSLTRKMVKVS